MVNNLALKIPGSIISASNVVCGPQAKYSHETIWEKN